MAISRIESNSIAPSQTLTTPIIATTMGVGGATPSGSGSGITFPATQSASTDANTLDDYEEGTWTPTDQSGAGLSLSAMNGYYTKIGRTVIANLIGNFPSTANGSNCKISLPFTTTSGSGFSAQAAGAMMRNGGTQTVCYCSQGLAFMEFYPLNSFTGQTNANMSGASIIATLVYQASA
jgi:hypothetical protein